MFKHEVFRIEVESVDVGTTSVLHRVEIEILSLEKPRTKLVALVSVDLVDVFSDAMDGARKKSWITRMKPN